MSSSGGGVGLVEGLAECFEFLQELRVGISIA